MTYSFSNNPGVVEVMALNWRLNNPHLPGIHSLRKSRGSIESAGTWMSQEVNGSMVRISGL